MRYLGAWLCLMFASVAVLPAAAGQEGPVGFLQVLPEGKVEWGAGRILAPGEGKPKADASGLQRQLTARNAAREAALAGLAKLVAAVSPGNGFGAQSAANRDARLKDIFHGSIVHTRDEAGMQALGYEGLGWNAAEDRFRVVIEVPLFGARSIAAALSSLPLPPSNLPEPEATADETREAAADAFTGLIVDCGKLTVDPSLFPALTEANAKRALYGPASVETDVAVHAGIARYYRSLEEARQVVSRVGTNPLVVRAAGGAKASVVVSPEDARRIQDAEKASKILSRCAVVVVLGR